MLFITIILLLSIIALIRFVIVKTVQSRKHSLIALCTSASTLNIRINKTIDKFLILFLEQFKKNTLLIINILSCVVYYDNFGFLYDCPCQTHQLLSSYAKIRSAFLNFIVEATFQFLNHFF